MRALVFSFYAGMSGCVTCPSPSCPPYYDLLAACTSDGSCTVDNAKATCSSVANAYGCGLSNLNAGSKLVISLSSRWAVLGTRNDFFFAYRDATDPSIDFSSVVISVDGQRATCSCGRFGCECDDIPSTATTLSLEPRVGALPTFWVDVRDLECLDRFTKTMKPCPV